MIATLSLRSVLALTNASQALLAHFGAALLGVRCAAVAGAVEPAQRGSLDAAPSCGFNQVGEALGLFTRTGPLVSRHWSRDRRN